jgi:hypothetical protein
MNYITAKETRVEKAWGKRGLAGLRSELLQKVGERDLREWDDVTIVKEISRMVWNGLPEREWDKGEIYIAETLGLVGIDADGWSAELMVAKLNEKTLREDIGDDFDE